MGENGISRQDVLTSWKEIARVLGVDERTCARWERSLGLPVHRLEGASKSRVFAYREELEAWVREKLSGDAAGAAHPAASHLNGQPEPLGASPSSTPVGTLRSALLRPVVIVPLVLAAAAGLASVLFRAGVMPRATPQPAGIVIDGTEMRVLDREKRLLWKHPFPDPIRSEYAFWAIADVNGDGRKEILFTYSPVNQEEAFSTLICFDAGGSELWSYRPRPVLRNAHRIYPPRYLIRQVNPFVEPAAGGRLIGVLATQSPWEACLFFLLRPDGTPVGQYVHPGHFSTSIFLREDLDGDGVKEIVLGGENNGYNQACLAVLDPRHVQGSSPHEGLSAWTFEGVPPGKEDHFLLFPRSSLCEVMAQRNRVAAVALRPDDRRIEVTVQECYEEHDSYDIKYVLDYDGRPLEARPVDAYIRKMKELQAIRVVPAFDPEEESKLLRRVRSWNGTAWTTPAAAPGTEASAARGNGAAPAKRP